MLQIKSKHAYKVAFTRQEKLQTIAIAAFRVTFFLLSPSLQQVTQLKEVIANTLQTLAVKRENFTRKQSNHYSKCYLFVVF